VPEGEKIMSNTEFSDKTALENAIEMENRGHQFFKESALKTKNVMAKEVFEYLAEEELNHLIAIKKFSESQLTGTNITDSLIEKMKKHESPIEQLFSNLSDSVPTDGGELDVYEFAADFELKGELFYTKAEAETSNASAKKLYAFLIGEERRHFKIIESCQAYFENPAEFFHQREKWHFEG
jgi:rubrerythrin